ncbi:PAS domain S-box protein, partial [Brevibacterium sp. SIMBA_078]|uniref:PAS domain S-box protein n=1 Tax=Brevibacterium sp. SIMBA_078 TaxID=3085816 RepID=UPI00397B211A
MGKALRILKKPSESGSFVNSFQIFTKIFENVYEGIMLTDADKNIIVVNPAFEIVTGYKFEEVVGKNPTILQSGVH